MCGICGVFDTRPVQIECLQSMTDSIRHRGPDADGFFVEANVGLGMRRLSIIDVAGGKQPLTNEDGTVIVVFNGEIYNYPDLRAQLLSHGHTMRTQSDTECIAHLYEEYGADFVQHLRGMFAIALYDRRARKLLLARDRLGKKPLFYAYRQGRLLFGSEIKPILLAAPELRRINERTILPFFRFGFVPEPETAYEGIFKLPPGGLLEFDGNEPCVQRYWDLNFPENGNAHPRKTAQEYRDELDSILREAVRIRLMSEVPLGAFLSGGPDSSLVVAYMSQLIQEPVKTFTIAFDEAAFDEQSAALNVAQHCRTEHHVMQLSLEAIRREFFATLDEIVRHTDEPFGDSSALPTYYVSKLAREHVTVALGGDGADEVFGGYTVYQGLKFAQLYQRLPKWTRRSIIIPAVDLWATRQTAGAPRWDANSWQKRLADSELPLREMLASKFSITTPPLLNRLVPNQRDGLDSDAASGALWVLLGSSDHPFEQTLYATTRFDQVNDMLVKVDRMSMAHGLEVRHPYLDHKVVEFAATIPPDLKLRGFETKAILRDIAARYLPKSNARKKKHGFGVPIPVWFREALYPELRDRLASSQAVADYLAPQTVNAVIEAHRQGVDNYSQLLWCLLIFDSWHHQYIDRV